MNIGVFDLETSNLNADFGIVLCGVIKPFDSKRLTVLRLDDMPSYKRSRSNDRSIAKALKEELEKYDIWVSYNGRRFDIPFLNARLMFHRLKPLRRTKHIDLLYQVRYKLKIHSGRLQAVQEFLGLSEEKTRIYGQHWVRALTGNRASWNYIVDHCKQDVRVLDEVYQELKGFVTAIYQ